MLLARFWNDRRGGVAPILAITIVPLIGFVGAAVDYTRASAARVAFQTSLDATALMLAKSAISQTSEQLQNSASSILDAEFTRSDVKDVSVTAQYSSVGGSKVTLTGSATVPTDFLNVLGFNAIPINASSTATWGNSRLRVALVLDNTGSMSHDGKMTALKTASHNLLTQLQNAATVPEDVYVSIIPFNKDVNVGSSNYDQPWLNWDLWDAQNGTCSYYYYHSKNSCESHGKVWTPAAHSTWNGCLTDRDQNYDTTNDPPVSGSTLYPTEQYSACPAKLMGLSNDWDALSAKIEDMQPNGNTNQAIGLQMGWQSLTASPFTIPAMDSNYEYHKAIILLSDGLNTQDRWYYGASAIDARQKKTCDNLKAAGITIYAIQVNTGGDPTSTLLQYCASDASKFYLLTSADQIVAAFDQIGTALSNLRLSM
jgi:Flp pilus assembly protein TadG